MFAEVFSKEGAAGMRQPLVTGAARAGCRSWRCASCAGCRHPPGADWAVPTAGRAVLRSAVRAKRGVASFGKGLQLTPASPHPAASSFHSFPLLEICRLRLPAARYQCASGGGHRCLDTERNRVVLFSRNEPRLLGGRQNALTITLQLNRIALVNGDDLQRGMFSSY